ncbi:hypothetical protein NEOLEDRAFT_1113568 [Neolentinus lepideus HHB14362 ss-1]|uniref:F-box domain-containing protein n=1 Tax=Neolentinus lepideus HHB14362 ss-1 TaxID=1314782 RepID=A0A165T5N4_9AGAM|nr:hypothetical protein NEOLEDRAFT_1113568 [Neolentinus lepideus HHB14362 ss-1]
MVSADNLNLDVLELIFAYLSGNDLVSVALVSRSFFAGVIPRLYHTLGFRLSQSKKYPRVQSPFGAVMAHPDFAIHVRHIDIRRVPVTRSGSIHHPEFIRDCTQVISAANNLTSFTLTVDILPSFLLALQGKERLRDLRIYANLTTEQSKKLVDIRGLHNLTLDYASWTLIDMLPTWARVLSPSLTSLTLYMASDLNELVLRQVLCKLPNLTGLHVIGCGKTDHVAVLKLATLFTPRLESLSMTTWENPHPLPDDLGALPYLRHLALDTHCSMPPPPSTPSLWTTLFKKTADWSCPLSSVTLKLSERVLVADNFIKTLLDAHDSTLRNLFFVHCRLSIDSLKNICQRCRELEKLGIGVPVREIEPFIDALALSGSLHALIDLGTDKHTTSSNPRLNLSKDTVEDLMEATNIRMLLTETRRWTGMDEFLGVTAKLERRKPIASTHWFMPKT